MGGGVRNAARTGTREVGRELARRRASRSRPCVKGTHVPYSPVESHRAARLRAAAPVITRNDALVTRSPSPGPDRVRSGRASGNTARTPDRRRLGNRPQPSFSTSDFSGSQGRFSGGPCGRRYNGNTAPRPADSCHGRRRNSHSSALILSDDPLPVDFFSRSAGVGSQPRAAQRLSALKRLPAISTTVGASTTAILCEVQVAVKAERLRGVRREMNGDTVRIRDSITAAPLATTCCQLCHGLVDPLRRLRN